MKRLTIKRDPVKGRGVYAHEIIHKGEIIEVCNLLIVDEEEIGDHLSRYVFHYKANFLAIVLGNGSLYNHSKKPNVTCYFDYKKEVLIFEAKKTINPGEELLINYGYSKAELKQYNIT